MILEFIETFARSIMVGIMASITVGPVAVLCIQRTLSKSRRSGIMSGLGVSCADTLMAIVAYFFYSILQSQIEAYDILLRVVGGIFVVGVGVFIFLQNPVMQIRRNRSGKAASGWQDFISIFGLTLANFIMVIPYILAFFAVFKISAGGAGGEESAVIEHTMSHGVESLLKGVDVSLGFFLGSAMWWTLLACVISLFKSRFRPRHMVTINHVAGAIIGGLGAYTIISAFINVAFK